ncbi:fad oxidoreductase-like protein [Dinothrombium tinctorium]|uniref:FAD-dependent oxidoreductase domain-containing protein 1 n=1 Tax=Dinothrombium tinctorium TaxID=1965070 RepID=A0A3S3SI37_9ACAR|nr:fad oxidoreductase-like protein [Dinothrombium tinctorium]
MSVCVRFVRPLLDARQTHTALLAAATRRFCSDHSVKQRDEIMKMDCVELREKMKSESNPNFVMKGYKYRYSKFVEIEPWRARKHLPEAVSDDHMRNIVPEAVDIVVIGGGIIGSSIAYFLKQRAPEGFSLCVVEKDPEYTHAATSLSLGGMRQQFSLYENIRMSTFSADFFRNYRHYLSVLDYEPPDIEFQPQGYLFLGNERNSEDLLMHHQLQTELGVFAEVYNAQELNTRFPWLNTEDIIIGAYGLQNEGWFNPRNLLIALKGKAEFLGTHYVAGELVDFNVRQPLPSLGKLDEVDQPLEECNHLIVKTAKGELKQIQFAIAVIAAGAWSQEMAEMLRIGETDGYRSVPLPIEPRKRYVYAFNCIDGPGINFPYLVDPSGVFCRRDGLGGNYLAGKSPSEDEEPDSSNLEVDYSYFDKAIQPVLTRRVKGFEKPKIVGAWAGYYDYNTFDQSPVIGAHPYYNNIYWATGFGGNGVQMAPAVGRAIMELILDHEYVSLDLTRFGWKRLFINEEVRESLIL